LSYVGVSKVILPRAGQRLKGDSHRQTPGILSDYMGFVNGHPLPRVRAMGSKWAMTVGCSARMRVVQSTKSIV